MDLTKRDKADIIFARHELYPCPLAFAGEDKALKRYCGWPLSIHFKPFYLKGGGGMTWGDFFMLIQTILSALLVYYTRKNK